MRIILLLITSFIALQAHAQQWKEFHVTATGDTIKPGTKITISDKSGHRYVMPSLYDNRQVPYSTVRNERNRRYLTTDMPGKTYPVHRLTRKKVKDGYIAIAVLLIGDYSMSAADNTEFNIYIDKALDNKEVAIVK